MPRTQPEEPRGRGLPTLLREAQDRQARADRLERLEGDRVGGPCNGCRNFERCTAEQIACAAFVLYAKVGDTYGAQRWSVAPRFPSRAILEQLLDPPRPPTATERRRRREALAVSMQRDAIA